MGGQGGSWERWEGGEGEGGGGGGGGRGGGGNFRLTFLAFPLICEELVGFDLQGACCMELCKKFPLIRVSLFCEL